MKKRTIIYIACAVAVTLIIAFAAYFIIKANKSETTNVEQKIIITKYNDNFETEKTIEITDKKQIKEINEICENPSLEQDEISKSIGIGKDVIVNLGNGKLFTIQLNLPVNYCHYEDTNSNTKLVIKMPQGLLEKVNNIIVEN